MVVVQREMAFLTTKSIDSILLAIRKSEGPSIGVGVEGFCWNTNPVFLILFISVICLLTFLLVNALGQLRLKCA